MAPNTTRRTLALAAVGLIVAATTAACSGSSTGSSSTGSSSTGSSSTGSSSFNAVTVAETGLIGGLDYGPLEGLIGTWKSDPNGPSGVDVAPGQADTSLCPIHLCLSTTSGETPLMSPDVHPVRRRSPSPCSPQPPGPPPRPHHGPAHVPQPPSSTVADAHQDGGTTRQTFPPATLRSPRQPA